MVERCAGGERPSYPLLDNLLMLVMLRGRRWLEAEVMERCAWCCAWCCNRPTVAPACTRQLATAAPAFPEHWRACVQGTPGRQPPHRPGRPSLCLTHPCPTDRAAPAWVSPSPCPTDRAAPACLTPSHRAPLAHLPARILQRGQDCRPSLYLTQSLPVGSSVRLAARPGLPRRPPMRSGWQAWSCSATWGTACSDRWVSTDPVLKWGTMS